MMKLPATKGPRIPETRADDRGAQLMERPRSLLATRIYAASGKTFEGETGGQAD